MQLPKDLANAVMFANWCRREKQEPAAVGKLIALARKAFKAGEHDCNAGTEASRKRYERAMEAFEKAAVELGYRADWPGLWPCLTESGGAGVHLPSLT